MRRCQYRRGVHCAIATEPLLKMFNAPLELCEVRETAVRGGAESFKGSQRMGDGLIFVETSAPHSLLFNKDYRMNLLLAKSISLDRTFKQLLNLLVNMKINMSIKNGVSV